MRPANVHGQPPQRQRRQRFTLGDAGRVYSLLRLTCASRNRKKKRIQGVRIGRFRLLTAHRGVPTPATVDVRTNR